MKTERFPWRETIHRVAEFERTSLSLARTAEGKFINDRGDLLSPPRIFGMDPATLSSEDYLRTLPFANGDLRSGVHFFLLMQAGAFAVALWEDGSYLRHKVKKRYVIRAGAGRAQSTQNNRHRVHSAGAQLRARNEGALFDDLESLLKQWRGHLSTAATLFYSAPPRLRGHLFNHLDTVLPERADPRWCKIPLDLGRPGMEALRHATFEMTHGSILRSDDTTTAIETS